MVAGIANPLRPLVRRRDGGQGHGSAASLGGDVGGERDGLTAVAGVDVVAKKSASFCLPVTKIILVRTLPRATIHPVTLI